MTERRPTVCLWFAGEAEDAARFYAETFDNGEMSAVQYAPGDYPAGETGSVLFAEFAIGGQPFLALNGKDENSFDESISIQIFTETQEQTDRYWAALTANGGGEMPCSWCHDCFGVRWQIVPEVLMDGLGHDDPQVRARVIEAMQKMTKIDHATIEAAISGGEEK